MYASNVCGYSWVYVENIYNNWIRPHFHCDHDMGNNLRLQLALRAVDGLAVDSLSDREKEYAARGVECGYLYRDGDKLYTKILVCQRKDQNRLFGITNRLMEGHLAECAEAVAEKVADLIRRFVPEHLMGEWESASDLGNGNVLDSLIAHMVEKGMLVPPEGGLGAEGCWMVVEK